MTTTLNAGHAEQARRAEARLRDLLERTSDRILAIRNQTPPVRLADDLWELYEELQRECGKKPWWYR